IFVNDHVLNLSNRAWLLHQVPDSRPDRIETVVDAVLDVQDRGFPGKVAGYLVFGRHDDGAIGNNWAHTHSSSPLEFRGRLRIRVRAPGCVRIPQAGRASKEGGAGQLAKL